MLKRIFKRSQRHNISDPLDTAVIPSLSSEKQFRIVVHVGAGKTGSTSIQAALQANEQALSAQGMTYWGLMLEQNEATDFVWQNRSHAHDPFAGMRQGLITAELQECLTKGIAAARAIGYHTAIWSNEAFFDHDELINPALNALADNGIDVRIVAFVRRYDTWLRSAYIQWGIKHKTYDGPIKTFEEYRRGRPVGFAHALRPYAEKFPDRLHLLNFDATNDVVARFFAFLGVAWEARSADRLNETANQEELFVRAIYNNRREAATLPHAFDREFTNGSIDFGLQPQEWFAALFPTAEQLAALREQAREDQAFIDFLLQTNGEPALRTDPVSLRPAQLNTDRLLGIALQALVSQATRISALESRLALIEQSDDHSNRLGQIEAIPPDARCSGFLEVYNSTLVEGWAICSDESYLPELEIYLNGTKVGRATPSLPRPDLGRARAKFSFRFRGLPLQGCGHSVDVRFAHSGASLSNSPAPLFNLLDKDEVIVGGSGYLFENSILRSLSEATANVLVTKWKDRFSDFEDLAKELKADVFRLLIPAKERICGAQLPAEWPDSIDPELMLHADRASISYPVEELVASSATAEIFSKGDTRISARGAKDLYEYVINIIAQRHNVSPISFDESDFSIEYCHANLLGRLGGLCVEPRTVLDAIPARSEIVHISPAATARQMTRYRSTRVNAKLRVACIFASRSLDLERFLAETFMETLVFIGTIVDKRELIEFRPDIMVLVQDERELLIENCLNSRELK